MNIPQNAIAFISMRTGIKFQGLINVSGFHVDPGYKGQIVYSVYNASPINIQIAAGDPLFKIWFADLDQTSDAKYLWKGSAPKAISNDLVRGMSREVLSLQGLSERIRKLEAEVDKKFESQRPIIDNLTQYYRTITASLTTGLSIAAVLAILSFLGPIALAGGRYVSQKFFPGVDTTFFPALGGTTDKDKTSK